MGLWLQKTFQNLFLLALWYYQTQSGQWHATGLRGVTASRLHTIASCYHTTLRTMGLSHNGIFPQDAICAWNAVNCIRHWVSSDVSYLIRCLDVDLDRGISEGRKIRLTPCVARSLVNWTSALRSRRDCEERKNVATIEVEASGSAVL